MVKVGDRVKVKVLEVDVERRRIGLVDQAGEPRRRRRRRRRGRRRERSRPRSKGPPPKSNRRQPPPPAKTPFNNPFAAAFGKK